MCPRALPLRTTSTSCGVSVVTPCSAMVRVAGPGSPAARCPTVIVSVTGSGVITSPKKLSLSPLLVSAEKNTVRSLFSTVNGKLAGVGRVEPPVTAVMDDDGLRLPACEQSQPRGVGARIESGGLEIGLAEAI